MKWRDRQGSGNVEDRRSQGGGGGFRFPFPGGGGGFPGGGRFPIPGGGGGGMSIITVLIVFGLMLLFGIDPRVILQGGDQQGGGGIQLPGGGGGGGSLEDILRRRDAGGDGSSLPFPRRTQTQTEDTTAGSGDDVKQFVSVVLADTETVWTRIFQNAGKTYDKPGIVLFRGQTRSGCGVGVAQMGPFYCPLDGKVYLDASFFQQLAQRFRAPGDFAQAYVIAHEVGHHVQTLLGITEKVERAKRGASEEERNAIQVRMELQADCLAGMWAHEAQKTLQVVEQGDIEEALGAATAIGDDRIQRRTTGVIVPESFTHGTSDQRVRWFKLGFETGKFASCDTFQADSI